MSLPYFYISPGKADAETFRLDEDSSRHIVQVLRMHRGEELLLTDGTGNRWRCSILEEHKKHCLVNVLEAAYTEPEKREISIGISLLKNSSRLEWFLEKATEIGVTEIIPLVCERTEKEKFRMERMRQICISAMLQSQQARLPVLSEPVNFDQLVKQERHSWRKLIATCANLDKKALHSEIFSPQSSILLIGPEGDFTGAEISLAIEHQFIPVSLGLNRLRTETAALVAAVLLKFSA